MRKLNIWRDTESTRNRLQRIAETRISKRAFISVALIRVKPTINAKSGKDRSNQNL